jgi:peptidoglycan hydrolase-like protein with peptidoglycan-binding domain
VRKKPQELVEDDTPPETLSAGPIGILASVLIAVMSSAILHNLIWRQNGQDSGRNTPDQGYVEIIAAETKDHTSKTAAQISLKEKSRGRDPLVAAVQKELAALGLFEGAADGIAGHRTHEAVIAYQRRNRLAETGKPDHKLLDHIKFTSKLLSVIEYTDTIAPPVGDDRVRKVQKGLAALGYRPGEFDGFIGQQTREAIQQFERDRGWPVTGEISNLLIAELADIGAFTETKPR